MLRLDVAAPLRVGVLLVALLVPALLRAAPPARWEPVPPEQLALTRSTISPGAGAEALSWRIWVEDEVNSGQLRQVQDHYVRIKIYSESGAQDFSKIDIDYPMRDVSVENIDARTIRPDGTIVPLDRRTVAGEVVVKTGGRGVRRKSFAPPQLGPGCVLEYRYRKAQWGVAAWTFDLQRDIPVRKLSYFIKPLEAPGWFLRQARFHTAVVTSPYPEGGYFETSVTDLPAYVKEPFSPPEYQQRPWLLQYYTMETLTTPDDFWKGFAHQWSRWFDAYIKPSKELVTLADEIAGGATSPVERVRRLATWIQREFHVYHDAPRDSMRAAGLRWNNTMRDALRQRAGTEEDANLLFAALARALQLDTRLLRAPSHDDWFFDRNAMLDGYFVPNLQVAVRLDGRWECFYPATAYLPWDMVPWDQEAQPGLLCDADSSGFVETPVAPPERTRATRTGTLTVADDGTLEGDVTLGFAGHLNEELRTALEGVTGAEVDSTLFDETDWTSTGLELSHLELLRGTDPREPLQVKCHVRGPQFATVTGKRMLLEPGVFHARRPAPFTAAQRRAPIYFRYAWSERDSLHLRLPEGWRVDGVDSLPPVEVPGTAGLECRVKVSDDGREIVFERAQHVGDGGSLLFARNQYAVLKRLFDRFHERDGAVVTLVRAGEKP